MTSTRHEKAFKLLALCLPLLVWGLVDLGLWLMDVLPPEDPLRFYTRTFETSFSPFEDADDGYLTIKDDWVSDGGGLRDVRGQRAGRIFLLPGFRPNRIAIDKGEDAVRVFVLGGSTTFGLGVGAEDAFASRLGQELQVSLPERKIEMVNLGCPGWASGRVKNLVATVLELEPDLVVVYSGHNEMLEGHSGSKAHLKTSQKAASSVISFSPTLSWAQYVVHRFRHADEYQAVAEEHAAMEAGQALVYDPNLVPLEQWRQPPEEFFTAAASEYQANLQSIIARTSNAKVPLLLVLPVANGSMPPAASAHAESFADDELFETLLDQARGAIEQQRSMDGVAFLDRALQLSPRFAMAHFWRASALNHAGQPEQAFAAYQQAVDLDVRTHRITSRLERVLIETATTSDTPWIDLRPIFRQQPPTAPPEALFFDYCHPTRLGHRLISNQLSPAALQLLAD